MGKALSPLREREREREREMKITLFAVGRSRISWQFLRSSICDGAHRNPDDMLTV